MYTSHEIRIYDRNFNKKDIASVDSDSVANKIDYLTLAPSIMTIPKIVNVGFEDYIYSDSIQGIVNSVDYIDGKTIIVFLPMLSLLDVTAFYDRGLLGSSLLDFFGNMIDSTLKSNADDSQNIPGLEILNFSTVVDVSNATLNIVDNVNNIYELAVKAFNKYRLVVDVDLQPEDKRIVVSLKINQNERYIQAKQPFVIDSEVFIQPNNQGINKLVGVWREHEPKTYTVKKSDAQDVSRPITEYFDGETEDEFQQNVKDRSYELFAYDETSNYIAVVINSDSNLYSGFSIGDLTTIRHENVEYAALLTQITKEAGLTTYIFGTIRLNLTDKLILGGF
ncbi:MAG: hypothetical protein J6Q94_01190 [Clostridia bacterium]|nr:hypothetical protein [Clostridia bacterium]